MKRFHQYLYGRRFTLLTDHKILTTIFGPKKRIPPIAAARLQRWEVQLATFSYDIEFKSTHDHGNADALSRLPLKDSSGGYSVPSEFNICQIMSLPVTGSRSSSNHPGVTRMKAITRSHFWWPGLDKDLEKLARTCVSCQAVKQAPASAPLHPWIWPTRPWQRVHIDFAGPFLGKMYFLVIDAHSKWGEVFPMSQTTTMKYYVNYLHHMDFRNRLYPIMDHSLYLRSFISS